MRQGNTPLEIDRRPLLKWLGDGTMAFAGWSGEVDAATTSKRDLVAVSNAGDNKAGISPSVSLIDAASHDVLATVPLNGYYSFPATRWDTAGEVPLGAALAAGRTFAADCPDPCCGAV